MKRIKTILIVIFLILGNFGFGSFAGSQNHNPVILVPGINASWNWHVMVNNIFSDSWGFFPGVHVYDSLIQTLENEGFDVYVAFYDWRKSNRDSAFQFLKAKIDEVKMLTGAEKVDIVAHSMGGLVSRYYIQSDQFENDVERLVMLGVPNNGSSDAYSPWEGGVIPKNWGKSYKYVLDSYLWYLRQMVYPQTESNYELIHEYVPSLGELMPTYEYLREVDLQGGSTPFMPDNPDGQNLFLEDLNNWMGTMNLQSRVYFSNLGGDGESTVGNILVEPIMPGATTWQDGYPCPFPPAKNDLEGDNRVLKKSVLLSDIIGMPAPETDPDFDPNPGPEAFSEVGNQRMGFFETTKHTALPHRAIEEVIYWLRHPTPPISELFPTPISGPPIELSDVDIAPAPREFEDSLDFLFTENAKVEIIAPDGKIISSETSEIPFAEFEEPSDPSGPKIVHIPDPQDGQYQIKITGLNNDDSFDFATYYASDSTSELEDFSDGISEGEEHTYEIEFDDDSDNKIKREGEVTIDELIEDVKGHYLDGTIEQTENCEDQNLSFEMVKTGFIKDLGMVNMGRLDSSVGACVKIETWLETNDNKYQGAKSWYDIVFEASQ
ncbi:MAG: alpha/beta fold hydrolase [Candidatus Paceibacterota bacterium]|jgi:pimeloyl-ACP methyl ester carboxylesterase